MGSNLQEISMRIPKNINFIITAALLFGCYVFYCLWMMHDEKNLLWMLIYTIEWIASIICILGLRRLNYYSLILSYLLMLGALGIGIYLVHFVWTFWIFEQPTVFRRIINALNPRVSVFIIFPVFWFIFFSRPHNRDLFRK